MDDIAVYLPVLFPVFFIFLWTLILLIFSYISGWRKLSTLFQYPQNFHGKLIRFQSARMNWV